MSEPIPALTPPTPTMTPKNQWPAVIAMAMATFCIITTEMLPIGLLSSIATTFSVSTGVAGLTVSLPAILGGLFAPIVVLAAKRTDRKNIVCGLLLLLIIANLVSAYAPSLGWLLGARVALGLSIGGIWAIAGGVANRLVKPSSVGLATALIIGGVAAASVLGMPLGTSIGDVFDWRMAFVMMALLSTLALMLNLWCVPKLPVHSSVTVSDYRVQLRNPLVCRGLLLTLLLVASHFMAYTFIQPIALKLIGLPPQWLGPLLLMYGLIGMGSNVLIGLLPPAQIHRALLAISLGLIMAFLWLLNGQLTTTTGILILLLWGAAYGGVSISLMTWMTQAAPNAIEVATSLYIAVFYVAIASGAFIGGSVIDLLGVNGNLWLATLGALLTLALIVFSKRRLKA